jgi:transcriptional regulator with XRE-family HTH domain
LREKVMEMPGPSAPTARRRRLGLELRRLREAAGIKLDQVANRIDLTTSTLSRIETGKAPCRTTYLTAMLDMYGVTDPQQIQLLKDMAREGQRKGWWADYDDITAEFGIYVGLEEAAASLRTFEAQRVHGLLQTSDYAHAVFRASDRKATAEQIDRQASLRMKRQEALTRSDSPLELWVIMDEAVLHRPVGGPAVMRAQLDKLLEAAELPNITVQVLPFSQGAHAGINGPFCIIEFPGEDPPTVYIDSPAGNLFLDKPHQVRRWAGAFDQLRAEAMSPADSRELIARLSAET